MVRVLCSVKIRIRIDHATSWNAVDQNQPNGYAPALPGPPQGGYNPHYQPNYGPPPGKCLTLVPRVRHNPFIIPQRPTAAVGSSTP